MIVSVQLHLLPKQFEQNCLNGIAGLLETDGAVFKIDMPYAVCFFYHEICDDPIETGSSRT